jgi:hypothetical protein
MYSGTYRGAENSVNERFSLVGRGMFRFKPAKQVLE